MAQQEGGSSVKKKYILQTTFLANNYESTGLESPLTWQPAHESQGELSEYWYTKKETLSIFLAYAGQLQQKVYRVTFTVRSRPIPTFTESIFPDPYVLEPEYGIFSTQFIYAWQCVAEMALGEVWNDLNGNRISDPEDTQDYGTPLGWTGLQEIASYEPTGVVSIDEDTGVVTKDPSEPVDRLIASGSHPHLHFYYRVTLVEASASFDMNLEIWQPILNPAYGNKPDPIPPDYWIPPAPGAHPDAVINLNDMFAWTSRDWEVPA
jgi:hypothetical protein